MDRMQSSSAGDPLGRWEALACDLFVPLACAGLAPGFAWSFEAKTIGDLRLVDMEVTPHRVQRTRAHMARSSEPFFIVSQQVTGPGIVVQDNREAVLEPGDLALYDSTRPYELRFAKGMRQRIVRLPQRLLLDRLARFDRVTARPIRADTPLGGLLGHYLAGSFDLGASLDGAAAPTVAGAFADLLCAALRQCDDRAKLDEAVGARVARHRILKFIDTNLADANLDVGAVAGALRVSTRYVHALLREVGATPAALIWSRRLERCALALVDPDQARVPAAQIGYAWGFKDAAHFSRAFKAAYGVPPRDYRRAVAEARPLD